MERSLASLLSGSIAMQLFTLFLKSKLKKSNGKSGTINSDAK